MHALYLLTISDFPYSLLKESAFFNFYQPPLHHHIYVNYIFQTNLNPEPANAN